MTTMRGLLLVLALAVTAYSARDLPVLRVSEDGVREVGCEPGCKECVCFRGIPGCYCLIPISTVKEIVMAGTTKKEDEALSAQVAVPTTLAHVGQGGCEPPCQICICFAGRIGCECLLSHEASTKNEVLEHMTKSLQAIKHPGPFEDCCEPGCLLCERAPPPLIGCSCVIPISTVKEIVMAATTKKEDEALSAQVAVPTTLAHVGQGGCEPPCRVCVCSPGRPGCQCVVRFNDAEEVEMEKKKKMLMSISSE